MLRYIWILLFGCFAACKSRNDSKGGAFDPAILKQQIFQVNSARDTVLKTLHGSIITIPAGAFNRTGNVAIEVREAFSPVEILAAGLTTESNGIPLFSGGMIYIMGRIENEMLSLLKPLKVSMPNQFYDPAMKVFKGEQTDSGTINWVDPIQPDSTPQMQNWQSGKFLFDTKCRTCHSIFRPLTGPALANVEERGPWGDRKNLLRFINNPAAFMANDVYTQDLKNIYRGVVMTGFPALGEADVNAILDYLTNETYRPGAREEERIELPNLMRADTFSKQNAAGEFVPSLPCKDDTIYLSNLPPTPVFFSESGTLPSNPGVELPETPTVRSAESLEGLREGFTDKASTSGLYDFEIKTFGWYNVDASVQGYAGTFNVKLSGELKMEEALLMRVYLLVPRNKTLSTVYASDNGIFEFDKIDGGIPLFLGDRAILFAFGSKGDRMYYGLSEFWIQRQQNISLNIQETSETAIQNALRTQRMDGIDLGIEEKEKQILKSGCND